MKQNDSPSRMTPYELATLASRIYPERCTSDPKEALAAAERLLQEAEAAIERAIERADEEELQEKWKLDRQMPRINWVRALKQITGQERRDRAVQRFLEFMEDALPGESKQQLNRYKRDGFTPYDIRSLQHVVTNWLKEPKRKKGKQGRRISEHDGRLRTELVEFVPRKPRKRA
jgi:hypothetical protein